MNFSKKITRLKSKSMWIVKCKQTNRKQQNRRIKAQAIEIKEFKRAYFKL